MDKFASPGRETNSQREPSSRREFIKRVGISLAALMSLRCRLPAERPKMPRDRVRDCWHRLSELAQEIQNAEDMDQGEAARDQLVQDHQSALNEMVSGGDLAGDVAAQVQTAFDAAVSHIWRSNAPILCYEAVFIDYQPTSSGQLAAQIELLAQSDDLDPDTVAMAQAAIARDVTFLNLPDSDVNALYERLSKSVEEGQGLPSFDDLELEVSPTAVEAAQFLVELLLNE